MDNIGLDLHKRESQLCIRRADGTLEERRIVTSAARFTAVLGDRPRARILLEAATESEWVAQCLEGLGHEVIVADPGFAPMYATRSRRVKTDRRDARTLADAAALGAYRLAHRLSEPERLQRRRLAIRNAVVRTRARYVAVVRTLARQRGLRLPSGTTAHFAERLTALALPDDVRAEWAPLVALLAPLTAQIARLDAELATRVRTDPVVQRLTTVPGVGPVTAIAFVATLDTAARFAGPHQVAAYLGLVPSERSSGEQQHRGRITKAGNAQLRSLLVEAAWTILRSSRADTAGLRQWAHGIARRRGRKIAVVALARRLAGILFALWRDGTVYRATPTPLTARRVS